MGSEVKKFMAATALSRPVYTEFWIRPDVNEEYTLDDKLLYVYLITNRHFEQHAIYQLSKKIMMMELNMPEERFKQAFDNLENKFKVIKYSTETGEVAILDYLKYGVISKGAALTKLYDNLGKKVEDLELLKAVYDCSAKLLDNRPEIKYARDRMKELLDLASGTKQEIYIVGQIYPSMAGQKTDDGYFDKDGVYCQFTEIPF